MSYIGNPIISTDFPKDTFSGNGATVAFTMSIAPASVNAVIVVVSGITQDPSTYTISGTTLTFSAAPPTGTSNISVRHLGIAGTPQVPATGSVVTASIADANVTQAKLASNVAGTGPAFSAYMSAATPIGNATWTKLRFDTELFDTNSNFDTTNYRFTPTVAGYYQINAIWRNGANFSASYVITRLYKNGSASVQGSWLTTSTLSAPTVNAVVYLNGTTDYVEAYAYQNSGSAIDTDYDYLYLFNGALVRAA